MDESKKQEYKIQLKAFFKLLCVVGFALLYALGGIEHKELRRFIAPLWLTGWMFFFSRNWKVFLQAPLMMLTLSIGYGADDFWVKVSKRFVYALANGWTSIVQIFTSGDIRKFWILFCLNIVICSIVSIVLGVLNPIVARAEELLFGLFFSVFVIYMPKDYEQKT